MYGIRINELGVVGTQDLKHRIITSYDLEKLFDEDPDAYTMFFNKIFNLERFVKNVEDQDLPNHNYNQHRWRGEFTSWLRDEYNFDYLNPDSQTSTRVWVELIQTYMCSEMEFDSAVLTLFNSDRMVASKPDPQLYGMFGILCSIYESLNTSLYTNHFPGVSDTSIYLNGFNVVGVDVDAYFKGEGLTSEEYDMVDEEWKNYQHGMLLCAHILNDLNRYISYYLSLVEKLQLSSKKPLILNWFSRIEERGDIEDGVFKPMFDCLK